MNNKFKIKAEELFINRDYENALFNYSIALKNSPNDQGARLGAILSDLAMDREAEAQALFDYYTVIKNKESNPEEVVESLVDSIYNDIEEMSATLSELMSLKSDIMDGINYSDFKLIVENSGNFKEIFENILFSTKVLISDKDDLFDFIEQLIEYNYIDMAYNYIEGANEVYKHDDKIRELLEKLDEISLENRS